MESWVADLKNGDVGELRFNEPLSAYTTWKIGGPADVLAIPGNRAQLGNLLRLLNRHRLPWHMLGRGSNTLVFDRGYRGVVIKLGDAFNEMRFEGNTVTAGASYSFIKLSVLAGKEGLTGLEFAGGIPGTVGGAVYMNAGAHGRDVSRIFQSAEIVWEDGTEEVLNREQMQFSYRHSVLHERRGIVTQSVFRLEPGDRKEIAASMASFKDRRMRTQPLQQACAGSVFRNPPGDHAARLIEEAGLKGLRAGGAIVSPLHANFIVNLGDATAEDVLTLIETIQRTIEERYAIRLVPEVLMLGER